MGVEEAEASACVETHLEYHSCDIEILTCARETGRGTLLGGEFDWGGRLRKSIRGAQRFPQDGRKPSEECKGRRELDCDTDGWSRYESRT